MAHWHSQNHLSTNQTASCSSVSWDRCPFDQLKHYKPPTFPFLSAWHGLIRTLSHPNLAYSSKASIHFPLCWFLHKGTIVSRSSSDCRISSFKYELSSELQSSKSGQCRTSMLLGRTRRYRCHFSLRYWIQTFLSSLQADRSISNTQRQWTV